MHVELLPLAHEGVAEAGGVFGDKKEARQGWGRARQGAGVGCPTVLCRVCDGGREGSRVLVAWPPWVACPIG
jgi:hypothetical protein